tara:strand:+ start:239 stop:1138 length:900 start_codon:yes stop_codon:yes gene_type:complete
MPSGIPQPPQDPLPAYLHQGGTDTPQHEEQLNSENSVGRRWGVPALIAWVTLSAFAGALWFAYEQGVRKSLEVTPPLIKADNGPVKVPPDDPGGLEVPHQDKEIYERLAGGEASDQEEATLRPEAEKPVPKEELLAATSNEENIGRATTIRVPPLPKVSGVDPVVAEAKSVESETVRKTSEPQSNKVSPPLAVSIVPKSVGSKSSERQKTFASVNGYRVQLGAYRSAEAAESDWSRLRTRQKSLLGSLDHVIIRVDLGERGIYYRLQAGLFDGLRAARTICNKLKERRLGCLVARSTAR